MEDQDKGYIMEEPYEIGNQDISKSKIPKVWIILDEEEVQNIKDVLTQRFHERIHALKTLGGKNWDFITKYHTFFSINNRDLCEELIDQHSTKYVFKLGDILGKGKVGSVFPLKRTSSDKEDMLILKSIEHSPPVKYLSFRIYDYIPGIEKMNPSINVYPTYDTKGNRKIFAIQGTNFSNQTCMHLILNEILKDNKNYLYQYDAFYCKGAGYNVTELANAGDLQNFLNNNENLISDDFLMDMLRQITMPLSILKRPEYSFVHADLKARNVFVSIGQDGKPIYKIADFDKSSITWNGIRFYNATGDYGISSMPFILGQHGTYTVSSYTTTVLPLQVYTMHSPYGFYLSYDMYSFMLSLFAIDSVYKFMAENPRSKFFITVLTLLGNDNFHKLLLPYLNQETVRKGLERMGNINTLLVSSGLEMFHNIKGYYKILNIPIPEQIAAINQDNQIIVNVSSGGHICLGSCEKRSGSWNKWCYTNPYSKTLPSTSQLAKKVIYHWDYC